MNGLVVYHSKWGNCKAIAENVARGLEEAGHEVTVKPVTERKVGSDYDFLAAGGPTRMGMKTGAMSRFLRREIKRDWSGKPFIAFGTGARPEGEGGRMDKWSARGAERIYEKLFKKGLKPVTDEPFKAYVEDMQGPLEEGSEEKAFEFGREAGARL